MSKFIWYEPIDEEELVDIAGYEGRYKVTSLSRVIAYREGRKPQVLRKALTEKEYHSVKLTDKSGGKWDARVHVLVAIAFVPNPENKPEVNHIDGVKVNNLPYNLEWNTRTENIEHARKSGLLPKGESVHFSKLVSSQVLEIFNSLLSQGKLAKKYGVGKSSINAIKTGKSWCHITNKIYTKKLLS